MNLNNNINLQQDTTYFTVLNWTDMEPPPGIETFYFINNNTSLSELIKLLNRYDNAPSKGKKKLAIRIQDQINLNALVAIPKFKMIL